MILQVHTKPNKTLIQLGILKVKDLVFKRGQKGYNRKVYNLIQEIKTHLPKSQDRQPEQADKENNLLRLSLEGKEKSTGDISMKQIYGELQSRVSINTPYKGKWEKILNEQNIDWAEIWNTVHQTTTTFKVKSDIFSQIRLSFYCNYIHQKTDSNVAAMCNLCGGEMKTHYHEILSCKTVHDIVDHFRPIIPAIDSKAISRRELIFGLTLGDKSMNLQNMIIFTIRSCVHRSRNAQFTSINSARSKLINMVKVQLSRVMWESYNLALEKNDSGNYEQAFLIGNLISKMEEGKLILCDLLAN